MHGLIFYTKEKTSKKFGFFDPQKHLGKKYTRF